jgi:Asp-tRNA(Asn)/Glu-tRNA(Gln) amidotransferase A subunit family amidase
MPMRSVVMRRLLSMALGSCALPVVLVAQPPSTPATVGAAGVNATIAGVHAQFRDGSLTCRALVQAYLDRIAAFDQSGPAINSLVTVNPNALAIADSLDRRFAREGLTGPLHCVPMIVKDNFETRDLQTTGGSLALAGWVPTRDATQVARVRAAGAIVLAKSNMAEWAFTPYETVSSILPGYTKNPWALDRTTAGSSGGTAAAIAASLGLVGLGTDTGNSIRGPSSHQGLVGIRSTMGLTSRAGVIPLFADQDIAGPMARTIEDAAAVFAVIAGPDSADPVTLEAARRPVGDYAAAARRRDVHGLRIGVLRQAYERPGADAEVLATFDAAMAKLRKAGATIVDPAAVPALDSILRISRGGCSRFRHDLEAYFVERGEGAPVTTIAQVLESRKFHPTVELRLRQNAEGPTEPDTTTGCRNREAMRAALRTAVTALMDSLRLDALAYPTWSNVPRKIGDLNSPAGDNSQLFSPQTGFPAITVPMGMTRGGTLPAGVTVMGRAWDDAALIGVAAGVVTTLGQSR